MTGRLAIALLALGVAAPPFAGAPCPECGTITGTVVDSTGAAVAGALVTLDVVPPPGDHAEADSVVHDGAVTRFWAVRGETVHFLGAATTTSAAGDFWVDGLPEGIYTLRASVGRQASDGEPVAVLPATTSQRVVRVRPGRGD